MSIHVLRSYRYITVPSRQLGFGEGVIKGLTDHATDFPSPDVDVITLGNIQAAYSLLVTAARLGDKEKIKERTKYYDEVWLPAFDKNAGYVERTAGENSDLILAAGYKPSKNMKGKKKLHEDVPVRMILEVSSPGHGALDYKSKTKVKARSFLLIGYANDGGEFKQAGKWIMAESKNGGVFVVPTTKKKDRITGLPSGAKMLWQIIALNQRGPGAASQPVPVIIQ